MDIDLSGSTTKGYTFLSGTTYYIGQSFYIAATSTTTFKPGCVIKYGYDAWLLLHCPISCPPTGQLMPVLTSKDDDQFGAMISGSTHNPTVMARQALLVYYVAESTTDIKNMRVRWASKGIEYDAYSGVPVAHILSDFLFQRCANNVYANMPNGFLTLDNVRTCDASIPLAGSYGALSGSFTEDCGPFYTVANFASSNQQNGPNQQEHQGLVPDTMGCAGPNHFTTLLNNSVEVYDKYTGLRLSQNTANEFFSLTIPSGPYAGVYPSCAGDPQIIFDHVSQRWIACAMDNCSNTRGILLAISNTSDPVGNGGPTWISDKWKKYLVPFPGLLDYPTLGVDGNGIYLAANPLGFDTATKIVALPKAQFLDMSAPSVPIYFMFQGPNRYVPSVNFDPVTASSPAWFVYRSGTTLNFNALKWTHGFAVAPEWLFPINWASISIPLGSIGDAPQLGSSQRIVALGQVDDNPKAVFARSVGGIPYLWLSVKLSVRPDGVPDNVNGDRWGIQWVKIRTSPNVMIADSDRIYDSAPTNPRFYYMPSVSVNKIGDMLIGFSGSSANEYVSTYYSGKLNNGVTPSSPIKYFTGKDWHDGDGRWGDYSFTSLDPDGTTIWTIQEYAETRYAPSFFGTTAWGLRIAAITSF